jgi:hypothetical protein
MLFLRGEISLQPNSKKPQRFRFGTDNSVCGYQTQPTTTRPCTSSISLKKSYGPIGKPVGRSISHTPRGRWTKLER